MIRISNETKDMVEALQMIQDGWDKMYLACPEVANNKEMINTHAMLCEQIRDKIKSRIDEQLNELNISHL
jgi:hypothetical protein